MNPITKTTPKDFFLHLGATIALYASIIALVNLSFSIINYYFPDSLAGYFSSSSIAWPVSMLIVLIPALYIIEWYIEKDLKTNPDKKDLWIRKWRIYLTLFLTGVVIIVDLVTLINTYLNGEITVRFIYKVIAIIVINNLVFKYYFFSVNESMRWTNMVKKYVPWFGIAIVLLAIVFGFIVVGSPSKQRAMRFDNQRINDLQNIQWQVVNYWQQKGKLPSSLEDVEDSISGNYIPMDPESKNIYEYSVNSKFKFTLCADFSLKYEDTKGKGSTGYYTMDRYSPENNNWKHDAGRVCFERIIDPEKYPVNKLVPVEKM